jgi:hypothetical protein
LNAKLAVSGPLQVRFRIVRPENLTPQLTYEPAHQLFSVWSNT